MPSSLKTHAPVSDTFEVISPLAGKPAPKEILVDLARLETAYYECCPDTDDPKRLVKRNRW